MGRHMLVNDLPCKNTPSQPSHPHSTMAEVGIYIGFPPNARVLAQLGCRDNEYILTGYRYVAKPGSSPQKWLTGCKQGFFLYTTIIEEHSLHP